MKNPKLISKPFAQNGQKNVIPEKYETSMESNQATWDQGFGQITMLPVSAGGLPPKGQDFNGILNQMCETIVHISKGGVFKFSTDYATAINGYPKGAILQSEDEKKYYQSLIDNNKVNFNTASQEQIKTSWKLVMTDDLLDQLSKKLESSAIVQSTGTSTTSVMSQKASTDAFQPKGNYADKSSIGSQVFSGTVSATDSINAQSNSGDSVGLYINDGDPFISAYINGKWTTQVRLPGKNGTMALQGDCYTKIESDRIFQPKGNYAPAGNYALAGASYTKLESDNKYQKIGDYADKSSADAQRFNGSIILKKEIISTSGDISIGLNSETKPEIVFNYGDSWRRVTFQDKDGVSALVGDSYTKSVSDGLYQPKGNYQPAGNYALKGESYTKSESDNRYPLKSDVYSKLASDDKYGLKNTANKAESGWWKCGDTGLIYQWGKVAGSTSETDTRNFPIKFPNKCLIMFGSYIGNDWGGGVGCVIKSSSTFLQINHTANASWSGAESNFLAIGY
ncbi:gp53-like domain-containing protein [Proteus vulgaris]|uniref:Putative tail fiber protein gp53-like C-terminal domain-containing protein n=1 Tax=Proteus vulgaris TaxID=585 RepID=A0A6G6SMX6_PROVU|nr:hypothetical protein [Proteus vulgaris]QIF95141.1 hypothetical protein GTH24_15095 [Proteus vulgaris]